MSAQKNAASDRQDNPPNEKHWLVQHAEEMRIAGIFPLRPAQEEIRGMFIGGIDQLAKDPEFRSCESFVELIAARQEAEKIIVARCAARHS